MEVSGLSLDLTKAVDVDDHSLLLSEMESLRDVLKISPFSSFKILY